MFILLPKKEEMLQFINFKEANCLKGLKK